MAGAAPDGPAGQPIGQQLHVLVPATANEPAELVGCERKTWIIIDPVPHSRTEEPPNQASQPPHVNSLAPATNLLVRILFLPHLGDCKSSLRLRTKNFRRRIISSSRRESMIRKSAQRFSEKIMLKQQSKAR